jgi:uncharacterized protein Yka (UPF0111/DUF47 family)
LKLNIYEKLGVIQSKLKAPKGQYNSFGKYKYRSCEDILEAVKPLLAETKTVLCITDQMEVVGDRIYVRAETHLKDAEDSSSEIVGIRLRSIRRQCWMKRPENLSDRLQSAM